MKPRLHVYLYKPEVVSRRNHRPRHPKLFRPSDFRNEWLRLLPPDIARSGFSSFSVASPASTASRPNLDSQIYTQLLILLPDASSPPPTFLPDPDALSPAGVASAASASSPAATTTVAATALLLLPPSRHPGRPPTAGSPPQVLAGSDGAPGLRCGAARVPRRWPPPATVPSERAPPVAADVAAPRRCLLPPFRACCCAPRNPSAAAEQGGGGGRPAANGALRCGAAWAGIVGSRGRGCPFPTDTTAGWSRSGSLFLALSRSPGQQL